MYKQDFLHDFHINLDSETIMVLCKRKSIYGLMVCYMSTQPTYMIIPVICRDISESFWGWWLYDFVMGNSFIQTIQIMDSILKQSIDCDSIVELHLYNSLLCLCGSNSAAIHIYL
jgi:hypothetical protein